MSIHSKFGVSALNFFVVCFSGLALPADTPVAVVNGVSIAARWMDRNVQANVVQGQKDTPELRAAPIQVGAFWHVVRLTATRPYPIPGFDESKNLVQASFAQTRRAALLKRLSDAAVVK